MKEYSIRTTGRRQFVDITAQVREAVAASKVQEGICVVYCPHTTAGITINEHADPDVVRDLGMALGKLVPEHGNYAHSEGNSDSHIQCALIGPSQSLIVHEGRLVLGTWQGIFFCEFDGPRQRSFYVKVVGDKAEN
jgi:secondary thiamine-phosphate synthase enzyme